MTGIGEGAGSCGRFADPETLVVRIDRAAIEGVIRGSDDDLKMRFGVFSFFRGQIFLSTSCGADCQRQEGGRKPQEKRVKKHNVDLRMSVRSGCPRSNGTDSEER